MQVARRQASDWSRNQSEFENFDDAQPYAYGLFQMVLTMMDCWDSGKNLYLFVEYSKFNQTTVVDNCKFGITIIIAISCKISKIHCLSNKLF